MRAFAAPYLKDPTHDSLKAMATELLTKMPYIKDATHVGTTAAEAFDIGAGVCQDHTHVFLGCLRDQHIPARYVSGYLYDDT
ncbi:transglutaminase family protein, partial [Pseudomonas sp. HY2-MNA-CIBAN-0224]